MGSDLFLLDPDGKVDLLQAETGKMIC